MEVGWNSANVESNNAIELQINFPNDIISLLLVVASNA